jgi:hypothetical protein
VLVPLLVVQAVVSEVVQARLMAGRSGDPADVVADLVGTGLGLLVAHRRTHCADCGHHGGHERA